MRSKRSFKQAETRAEDDFRFYSLIYHFFLCSKDIRDM